MNLYDTISQSDLNSVIDLLLSNFHRELVLDLDEPFNDYCSLSFDLSEGLDAGNEVIFNDGDSLTINFDEQRLAGLGYSLRFYYYQLDKGDLDNTKNYGELKEFTVDLDDDTVLVPFESDQVYLQKNVDLILLSNTGSRLSLTVDKTLVLPNESVVLSATMVSGGEPVASASVSFYDGETLVGTETTNSMGVATLTLSDLSIGSHNFSSVCDGTYSKNLSINVIDDTYVIELTVTGDSFSTYASTPFTFNGRVCVDWGDDTGLVEYTGGYLQHNYSSGGEHTVLVYGNITSLGEVCFSDCTGLTSIELPSSVTSLGTSCFWGCTGLTSIELPSSVTSLGTSCFSGCTGLTSIKLNWSNSNAILTYNSFWIWGTPSSLKFHIPSNTTTLYTNKQYPSDKLVED